MQLRPFYSLGVFAALIWAGSAAAQPNGAAVPPAPQQSQSQNGERSFVCDNDCVRGSTAKAVNACIPRIEAEAPGDYDWVYRPSTPVFQEASAPPPGGTIISYRGDSIRFQNAQEKWVRVLYECGYDAMKGEVAFVRVRPGVMGKVAAVPRPPAPRELPPTNPPQAQAKPAAPSAQQQATVSLRRVGEPSPVDIRQIPPSAKPPAPSAASPATGQ